MKYIEQSTVSECGLACLAMIFSDYKFNVSLSDLRSRWLVGRDGINLKTLTRIAGNYGFKCTGIKTNDIRTIKTPCILYDNANHFVVIKKISKEGIGVIYDPANGIYKEKINKYIINDYLIYLQLELVNKVNIHEKDIISIRSYIYGLLNKYKKTISIFFLATIVFQLLNLSIPIIVKNSVNIMEMKNISNRNWQLISLTFIYVIISYMKSRISNSLRLNIDKYILKDFVESIYKLPYVFFTLTSREDIIYKYNGSVVLRNVFTDHLFLVFINIGTALLSLVYITTHSFRIAVFVVAMLFIECFTYFASYRKKRYLSGMELKNQASALEIFSNQLQLMKWVKVKSQEDRSYNVWKNNMGKYWDSFNKRMNFNTLIGTIADSLATFTLLFVFFISFCVNKRLDMGEAFAFYILTSYIMNPVAQVFNEIDEITYGMKYLESMIDVQNYRTSEGSKSNLKIDKFNIRLDNLSFRYSIEDDYALKNISCSINKGEFVGIVGKSGSGKSTLEEIILGLLTRTSGEIYIDNIPYNDLSKNNISKNVSVVQQKPTLINGTIAENIILYNDYDEDRLIEAAKNAELLEFIENLPMGFQTQLNNEELISGGQLQRIEIARALYDNPKVVIFDEATSSLDSITEEKIMQNVQKMNITRIVITHRLNTITNADKILVFDSGRLCGNGTHRELIKSNKYYQKLYKNYRGC